MPRKSCVETRTVRSVRGIRLHIPASSQAESFRRINDGRRHVTCRSASVMIDNEPAQPAHAARLALAFRWVSWLAAGSALILVAVFVQLSDELLDTQERSSRLSSIDAAILRFVLRVRVPWLNGIATDLTALGSPVIVALVTIAMGALLGALSDRRGVAAVIAASLASAPLTVALKSFIARPRPDVIPPLVSVTGLSYPSGHALAAAATYLTAGFVVARHLSSLRARIGAIAFSITLVLLTAGSRVYLGVHYPSDVLAGAVLGAAWALLMAALLARSSQKPGPGGRGPP